MTVVITQRVYLQGGKTTERTYWRHGVKQWSMLPLSMTIVLEYQDSIKKTISNIVKVWGHEL